MPSQNTLSNGQSWATSVGLLLVLVASTCPPTQAVSPGRLDKLTREDYLRLDDEVNQYFDDDYVKLDKKNVSYDEQLFKSIRSIRHTVVLHQFDFRYTNENVMRRSMGAKVEENACRNQLKLLVKFARATAERDQNNGLNSMPLSVINFLESSGHTEPGILNGNFVWFGSYASCIRAKIPADLVRQHSPNQEAVDVVGRYCMAHLRAKSWPKWDIYFEDRITIRKGICLPESCHTALYQDHEDIRRDVDYLARYGLLAPFNDNDRYETSYLYCLPDEDSPYRQLDLGAKLFIAFACFWVAVLLYTNLKYRRRMETVRKLRETVDFRMIINELGSSRDEQEQEPNESDGEQGADQRRSNEDVGDLSQTQRAKSSETKSLLATLDSTMAAAASTGTGTGTGAGVSDRLLNPSMSLAPPSSCHSSTSVTPLPSDIDDNDSDIQLMRTLVGNDKKKSKRHTKRAQKQSASDEPTRGKPSTQEIDFVKAFSIQSNLAYLLKPRSNQVKSEDDVEGPSRQQQAHYERRQRGSQQQQLAAVGRRTSNEALIKGLCDDEQVSGGQKSKVAIVSGASSLADDGQEELKTRGRRVNIEILDGIKVVATSYIIYGHTMMFFFGLLKDLRFAHERMLDVTMGSTLNTLQVVGLFYVTTGLLLTYFTFSKTKLKHLVNPFFWLLVMVGRYFRLIPAYMLVFWFTRHVAPHTGAGDLWTDYRTDEEHARGFCGQESWWIMWSMSAADVKIPLDCIPQAWYLSNDFRTLMVLPLYIFILAKNALAGYLAIFSTIIYSTLRLVKILRLANIDYKIILQWKPHVYALMADRIHDVYTDFYVRVSTYLLGVILGHLLYLYEIRRIKQWPNWLRQFGLKISLATAILFFLGPQVLSSPWVYQFLPSRDEFDSDTVVLLLPIFKLAMEISICIILIVLLTGGGFKWIRDVLASRTMKILSNISYAVFLTHVEVMFKLPSTKLESNYWFLFIYSCFFISVSHIISFFIYILYEMPINNVMRYLFKRAFSAMQ